jgi:hypothetical protein
MMYHRTAIVPVVLAIVFVLAFTYGQFGESAGALGFNVSLGGQESLNYTIFNQGAVPIGFEVVFQGFNPIKNTTMPAVLITPMNGTIQPHQSATVMAHVEMPTDQNDLKARWDGLIEVVEQQYNTSGQAGATVYAGLGKEIVIIAHPAAGISIVYIITMAAVAAAAAVAVSAYALRRRRPAKRAARRAPTRKAAARKKPARKAAGKAARKKAARKPAGRQKKTGTKGKTSRKTSRSRRAPARRAATRRRARK